jgi:hypothetical protein
MDCRRDETRMLTLIEPSFVSDQAQLPDIAARPWTKVFLPRFRFGDYYLSRAIDFNAKSFIRARSRGKWENKQNKLNN